MSEFLSPAPSPRFYVTVETAGSVAYHGHFTPEVAAVVATEWAERGFATHVLVATPERKAAATAARTAAAERGSYALSHGLSESFALAA